MLGQAHTTTKQKVEEETKLAEETAANHSTRPQLQVTTTTKKKTAMQLEWQTETPVSSLSPIAI
jgi:hypothetical protein